MKQSLQARLTRKLREREEKGKLPEHRRWGTWWRYGKGKESGAHIRYAAVTPHPVTHVNHQSAKEFRVSV